jgi:hypothetical protein
MSVDERRRRLNRRLEEVLGREEAETLRDDISGRGVSRDELRQELHLTRDELRQELHLTRDELRQELNHQESRVEGKLSVLGNELRTEMYQMKADLLQQMNEQTKTLYRTIVVSNATLAFAVAGIAFGAARLA